MTDTDTPALLDFLRNRLQDAGADQLRYMVQFMAERLMSAEADAAVGLRTGRAVPSALINATATASDAGTPERAPSSWRSRSCATAATSPTGSSTTVNGANVRSWPCRQSHLRRVSTRRVDAVVRSLGIEGIGKSQVSELAKSLDEMVEAFRSRPLDAEAYPYVWLDALEVKCREAGRVVNVACVVAIGVRSDGHREVLGVDVITTEDGAGWLAFLRSLVARGLKGVQLVTSDGHEGQTNTIAATLRRDFQQLGAICTNSRYTLRRCPIPLSRRRTDLDNTTEPAETREVP